MPTAAQISPKQEARKGILKSPPVRDEPVSKIPKMEVQIDLSDDNVGADVDGMRVDAAVGHGDGRRGCRCRDVRAGAAA